MINDDFKKLKVGDEVLFIRSPNIQGKIIKVQRITKAHIICRSLNNLSQYEFRKANGYQVHVSGCFYVPRITIIDEEDRAKIKKTQLLQIISGQNFEVMSIKDLESIVKIIDNGNLR